MKVHEIPDRRGYSREMLHHLSNAERFLGEIYSDNDALPAWPPCAADGLCRLPDFGSALGAVTRADSLLSAIIKGVGR